MTERLSEENPYESPRSHAQRTRGKSDQGSQAFRMLVIPVTLLSFYGCFSLLVGVHYVIVILFVGENNIDASLPERILFLVGGAPVFLIGLAALVAAWNVWQRQFVLGTVLGIGSIVASPVIGLYVLMLGLPC